MEEAVEKSVNNIAVCRVTAMWPVLFIITNRKWITQGNETLLSNWQKESW